MQHDDEQVAVVAREERHVGGQALVERLQADTTTAHSSSSMRVRIPHADKRSSKRDSDTHPPRVSE